MHGQQNIKKRNYFSSFQAYSISWNGCTDDTAYNSHSAAVFGKEPGSENTRSLKKCLIIYPNPTCCTHSPPSGLRQHAKLLLCTRDALDLNLGCVTEYPRAFRTFSYSIWGKVVPVPNMKASGTVAIWRHTFLTSALEAFSGQPHALTALSRFGEGSLLRIEPRFFWRPTRDVVTIPTELPWM